MRGRSELRLLATLLACAGCGGIGLAAPAAAQGSYSPYDESAASALARYVRTLASSPKDFNSLIGAGRSALELGDTQAAAGFFARADEVNPRSPLPQAGMGAVSVANGEPQAALPYFRRAEQLGLSVANFGCDRGLAYDLLGQQAQAQADYRAALNGADGDEARRRLALSLAISGDKAGALEALAPLMAKRDAGAARARAFVLALTGDSAGAMTAIDAAMPGSWSRVAPFLQRLPALAAGQKAAAVNLGIFPDANGGGTAYAYGAPRAAPPSTSSVVTSVDPNRLAGIEQLLRSPPPPPPAFSQSPARVAQAPSWGAPAAATATIAHAAPARAAPAAMAGPRQRKIWLQLASGPNAEALPSQFQRMKSKGRDLFDGIRPYVAKSSDRARLVIGPFRGPSDAETFAEDLGSVGIDAFRWSNSETDTILPLSTQ
jgi:tetratricopeptide (TPR) repeat protein